MFELIENLYPVHSGCSFPYNDRTPDERVEKIKSVAAQLLEEMGTKSDNKDLITPIIEHDPFLLWAKYEKVNEKHCITLPALSLIRKNEIPEKFRFGFSDNKKFCDRKLLQEFSDWICDRINCPRKAIETADFEAVKFYFRFMNNPEKAKLAVKFVLGHELAHYLNGDDKKSTYLMWASRVAGFSTSVIFWTVLSISLPVAIFVSFLTGAICSRFFDSIVFFPYRRAVERKADERIVTKIPQTADGAIYFFQLMIDHQKEYRNRENLSWKEKLIAQIVFSPSGNNRLSWFTHDTESDRIKNIQKIVNSRSKHFNNSSHHDFCYKFIYTS